VEAVFKSPEQRLEELSKLAGYLLLDALIGNTDRHHQNWGVLRSSISSGQTVQHIAPTFDHASSLGRNESELKLDRRLRENTVLAYARKGRGGIFWNAKDRRGANPLNLVERAAGLWPEYFSPWWPALRALDESQFLSIVTAIPDDWMTAIQQAFCVRFLVCTSAELRKIPL